MQHVDVVIVPPHVNGSNTLNYLMIHGVGTKTEKIRLLKGVTFKESYPGEFRVTRKLATVVKVLRGCTPCGM